MGPVARARLHRSRHVIAADTNILLYAHREDSDWHEAAHTTLLPAALDQVDAWLESPSVVLLAESSGYWSMLSDAMNAGRISGPQVHDARIAAVCLQHGVSELWSADRDFNRFPALIVRNPLIE